MSCVSNLRFVRGGLAASTSAGAGICLVRSHWISWSPPCRDCCITSVIARCRVGRSGSEQSVGCRHLCSSSIDHQAVSWIHTTLRAPARSLGVWGNTAQFVAQPTTHW